MSLIRFTSFMRFMSVAGGKFVGKSGTLGNNISRKYENKLFSLCILCISESSVKCRCFAVELDKLSGNTKEFIFKQFGKTICSLIFNFWRS